MTATILKNRDTCYSCAVRCKRVVETEWEGRPVHERHGGPEYETASTFGSYCGIGDLHAIALANQICNEHGLDTIGTGATIAWTMECFDRRRPVRGGDRLPGAVRGRDGHDPPARDDRDPGGLRGRPRQRLAAGPRTCSARGTTT